MPSGQKIASIMNCRIAPIARRINLQKYKIGQMRRESVLAKLMGVTAVQPSVGTPLILAYGLTVYGGVLFGLMNLPEQ
ncbi:Oidioi.mRNA.OKI2018_I69.chr2.g4706.t1.cds [Oikopleura dioica]|uniref:Oidioi.mRNA.OKI2018_I69.chr2.g4706.t1.cds n=1 Tax=Oikopleura dioica TaxID=34765 RepID=A0ABN7T797_OIKDI|nr:Oidioi.mRNA.OKI2018_I69.chr2.g4706.t1.cds [Oikopleura dioica]